MVKTEAFPTIRMKIDRLLKITNEYQFNDLVKAVYCINLCINNRSVLESCLALNACLIEYEEKGSKRIGTYDEFKGFFGKIYDVMKPGIADDYTVEDFGEVQLRYNDKFYRVIIGTGHNNVYACLNFLPTLARNISREEELCLALEYVSGTIDYFIEENKNDGVVEKRFVLPTEILFYKVQKFFKEEVKKYDILELDSLMMSEGTTIEKSHFVCREDNIYPLYNVSLLIDLYDIWENKIDFKEQISVANEGIIDRIYSLFEMDRSRSCSIFAPAMIFPEQKYDSSQRTYTFIAKASRGVVVALNADEYEEGQLEKEIANIEKYHKSGTLHIAETFNRFDKSGLRGIHIPADMPIEYLIYDSFMNPNQMHMSLGEEGKKRKTCTALDVIYYLNFMDDIDELFEYLSYSNEKDYESSFGFGSDAALYFTWKNQGRYIAKGAIIFNMVDVGYDTENEAVVVCPVDPYVDNTYYEAVKTLQELAEHGGANLTLMGIEPTYPSEKYGYIIPESGENVSKVKEFKEKPDVGTAKKYLAQSALWNAGIFAFKLGYLLDKAHSMIDFEDYRDLFNKYDTLTKISFDYAVVEKESSIQVLRYSGDWKDVGTWNMMAEVMADKTKGKAVLDETCENTNVVNELNIPILCMGCKDMIIAASGDGILIADKERSGYMKPYVEKIETEAMYAEKSWGSYTVIDVQPGSMTVKISMRAGEHMTYHMHNYREEVWTVVSGRGKAVVDGMEQVLRTGDVITIAAGCKHTVEAITALDMIEVQLGDEISVADKIKFPMV